MLILACLALGMAACHDDVLTPNRNARTGRASAPVTVAQYTCTLTISARQVRCSPVHDAAPGVSQSVVLLPSSPYAQFHPYDPVRDTVAQTWAFAVDVRNLLGQPIGTRDGTTVAGTIVAITYGPVVTGGTGTVTVANVDGTGNLTGPNQPYFFYDQLVAPHASSSAKLWRFHVPNTVASITFGIVVSTHFPAEHDVELSPPRLDPDWFSADSNWVDGGRPPNGFHRRGVSVLFKAGTSLADRQLAVAYVGGTVIGGARMSDGDGYYTIQIADDGSGNQLRAAVAKFRSLPQVEAASLIVSVQPAH